MIRLRSEDTAPEPPMEEPSSIPDPAIPPAVVEAPLVEPAFGPPLVASAAPHGFVRFRTTREKMRPADGEVYLPQSVYREVMAHLSSDTSRELGGLLLGEVVPTSAVGPAGVLIRSALAARFSSSDRTHLTFTEETWVDFDRRIDAVPELRDLRRVGWYHSHPGMAVFLSHYDLDVCSLFSQRFHVALVVDPVGHHGGFFVNGDGGYRTHVPQGFWELRDLQPRSLVTWKDVRPVVAESPAAVVPTARAPAAIDGAVLDSSSVSACPPAGGVASGEEGASGPPEPPIGPETISAGSRGTGTESPRDEGRWKTLVPLALGVGLLVIASLLAGYLLGRQRLEEEVHLAVNGMVHDLPARVEGQAQGLAMLEEGLRELRSRIGDLEERLPPPPVQSQSTGGGHGGRETGVPPRRSAGAAAGLRANPRPPTTPTAASPAPQNRASGSDPPEGAPEQDPTSGRDAPPGQDRAPTADAHAGPAATEPAGPELSEPVQPATPSSSGASAADPDAAAALAPEPDAPVAAPAAQEPEEPSDGSEVPSPTAGPTPQGSEAAGSGPGSAP